MRNLDSVGFVDGGIDSLETKKSGEKISALLFFSYNCNQ